ncbi:unnamed protein product [Trichogramma brassicae]|uniref:Uncharacterized protein n=1 Tax=Trichogramma brassicae TaxID=86971 RepID=A0A6H5IDX9_9HYME|nr:unnamed protein product [Trichogramma brassicae]
MMCTSSCAYVIHASDISPRRRDHKGLWESACSKSHGQSSRWTVWSSRKARRRTSI